MKKGILLSAAHKCLLLLNEADRLSSILVRVCANLHCRFSVKVHWKCNKICGTMALFAGFVHRWSLYGKIQRLIKVFVKNLVSI